MSMAPVCIEVCLSTEDEWEEVDSSESGSSDEMAGDIDMEEDAAKHNNNFVSCLTLLRSVESQHTQWLLGVGGGECLLQAWIYQNVFHVTIRPLLKCA